MLRKTLSVLALSLLAVPAFAQQAGRPIEFTGAEAKQAFEELLATGADIVENSVCLTAIADADVSCTLIGSHESCGREAEYICVADH